MITNDEERRQFTIVCRTALKLGVGGRMGGGFHPDKVSLQEIGQNEFGLSTSQVKVCLMHAREEIQQMLDLDRRRRAGVYGVPTDSATLVQLINNKNLLHAA